MVESTGLPCLSSQEEKIIKILSLPLFDDGTVRIRTAREARWCGGGYDRESHKHRRCARPIRKNTRYVEYLGGTSGKDYHLKCAVEQGLVVKELKRRKKS